MQYTAHYGLKKPEYTDFADVQDFNDNMDALDAKLASIESSQETASDEIAGRVTTVSLQGPDTPVRITVATGDWTASGSNFSCVKACAKATADAYCVLRIIPVNPDTPTAANLKLLQKNVSYLYPQPAVGAGTITFLASARPTIALSFDVIGGAVS